MERRMMIGTAAASLVAITVAGQWALERGYIKAQLRSTSTEAPASGRQRAQAPESGPARPSPTHPEVARDDAAAPPAPRPEGREEAAPLAAADGERAGAPAPRPSDQSLNRLGHRPTTESQSAGSAGFATVSRRVEDFGLATPRFAPEPLPAPPADTVAPRDEGRDRFADFDANPVKAVAEEPVSTFSIDVDTASYAFVRRMLGEGRLPDRDAVRVEEMINYFPYDYPPAAGPDRPFEPTVAVYPTPWNAETRLMHIGIKGYVPPQATRRRSNLVFLIDVSGSMQSPDKLPLLKSAFRLLLDSLDADDTVAIVTYAGEAGTALEPTRASERGKILAAIDRLGAGGSTAGAAGIAAAYALAEQEFVEGGVNRVILATDGDFNVGATDDDSLEEYIETKRESGIFLSVLGFGTGNYNDALMQTLAQNGNGNAAYIDTLGEARKVLVDEAVSTLVPIASDVKIQVEFNPATVAEYRLIGYETRALARQDFNNDRVDAGEVGSGHTVTAIYEVTPKGSPARLVDDLRYQPSSAGGAAGGDEYAFLKLRYKQPGETESRLIERAVTPADERGSVDAAPADMRFAAAVAAFGQKLRGGTHLGEFGYDDIAALARSGRGADPYGYRAEFLTLVRLAESLDPGGR